MLSKFHIEHHVYSSEADISYGHPPANGYDLFRKLYSTNPIVIQKQRTCQQHRVDPGANQQSKLFTSTFNPKPSVPANPHT